MSEKRNVIKWHMVTDFKTGEPAGLRGWDARCEDRYEMVQEPDGNWRVSVVFKFITDPNDWGFRQVGQGSVFDCMVAAEKNADRVYEAERQAEIDEQEERDR